MCTWCSTIIDHEVIVTGDPYSRRVLTGFWWLFVIVTVTTYCGNLVAFLTFPTIEYPISDLNTLVQKVSGPDVALADRALFKKIIFFLNEYSGFKKNVYLF